MESQYSYRKTQRDGRHSTSPVSGKIRAESYDESTLVDIVLDSSTGSGDGQAATKQSTASLTDSSTTTSPPTTPVAFSGNASSTSTEIDPSETSACSSNNMSIIVEKASRLLRQGYISEEEHSMILSNHVSAMNRTTIPLSPLPPPPVSRANATSSPPEASRLNRLSRRRVIAEQHAMYTLTKEEAQRQKESKKRHKEITLNMETWRNKILPRWEECKASSEVWKLVQKGIPTALRGNIWCKMLHNKLHITPEIYQEHLEEAKKMYDANGRLSLLVKPDELEDDADSRHSSGAEVLKQDEDSGDNMNPPFSDTDNQEETTIAATEEIVTEVICKDSATSVDSLIDRPEEIDRNSMYTPEKLELLVSSMTLIKRDIPRTFPTLSFFHDDGPLAASLDHVLKAYACYEPTIGYVQGMSYIAALLLLYMDEYETFVCFSNILAIRTNRDFYMLEPAAITGYVKTFNRFFKQFLPLLYDHFEEEGITNTIFLLDWHLTIFSKALPLEIAARIWDCYLHCGEVYVLRASLGLLRLFARRLSSLGMEKILPFLAHVPEEELTASDLINSIEQIRITPEKYSSTRLMFDENLKRDSVNMGALAPDPKSSPNFSFRKSFASMFS